MITIETTYPSKEIAEKVVRELFAQKLIACVIFSQVTSMFPWEGELQVGEEILTLIKLPSKFEGPVYDYIKKTHPYEIPMISKKQSDYYDSGMESDYSRWVDRVTG